ncbi:unnamed protein product [Effrenium voratum]|uniref:Uncharacterized protein n=1 Tax=Effrenium voratum TaxID=2562239 RepID=A0AA36N4D3_9DINO|nr:unnamed protein product [Effrenium voratum]
MIYCLCGVLIIVLRVVPRRLVSLRQQAWQILVKKSVTRGCPQWYRPFASSTIALWLDNSLTVMYISWACRLIFRIMPWMLEALNMIMPFWTTSRWQPIGFASGSQVSDAVYDNLMSVMRKLRVAALVALFSRMLLNLKDPNLSPSQIPMEPGQATKGATIVWRPLVWLMGMRVRPRLRTSNMRLLLADKCLTGAIYMLLLAVPLRLVNVQLRTVLAVGGVGGLAVGLALQNLVQNLISGILIYTNATICEGLEVELQDVNLQGVINEVGWFNTTVNGYGGARVTVPNRRILDGTVVDKTNKRYRVCQAKLVVVFEDPGKLEALVNAVEKDLRNNPNVLQSSSVLQIRMVNRGHIKIYEPQFCLTGWSPYGANFFLRAYMDKSLQGDVFLKYQSKLMIDVAPSCRCLQKRRSQSLKPARSDEHANANSKLARMGWVIPAKNRCDVVMDLWLWELRFYMEEDARVLAKRQAMALLSKQPVCRARRSGRFARWTWLEPSLMKRVPVLAEQEGAEQAEVKCEQTTTPKEEFGQRHVGKNGSLPLESVHEQLERQAACRSIAEVLAEKLGCTAPSALEDRLLAKEAEVASLQQEVLSLRAEKEQLESALEAAEQRIDELAAGAKVAPPPKESSAPAAHSVPQVPQPKAAEGRASGLSEGPKQQVAALRQERLEGIQSSTMREMFLGCVELLAADIYASRAHFVLELLQNADDNEYAAGVNPTARFICKAGATPYIAVVNNEVGLTAQDLAGMCAISKSAKKDKADRTGRKGIGFKSVFAVSCCPHVLSRSYTFKFDVRNDRMGYVTPSWLEEEELRDLPAELLQQHQEGLTVIYLPLGESAQALLSEVEGHLEALDPATLLFMRRLKRIEFQRADGRSSRVHIEARAGDGLQREVVSSQAPEGNRTYEFFVGRRMSSDQHGRSRPLAVVNIKEEVKAILMRAIMLTGFACSALPLPEPQPARAFATLPLCHTGLGVCINADWDVSASRDGVHENKHNEQLALETAQAFAEIVKELGMRLPASPVDYLGDRPPLSRFWRKVRERFIGALMEADVPCLAVEDAGSPGRFVSATQALRRPLKSSAAEQAACALVSAAQLQRAIQRCFVREPLPQGVQVDVFAACHFARCLPYLMEEAMATEDYADRVKRLAGAFKSFEDLVSEPRLSVEMGTQVRAELVRAARCWPCSSQTGSALICASEFGPIFQAAPEALAFRPSSEDEAKQRWRLRVLVPEAKEALLQVPRLAGLCHLRPSAEPAHLCGLSLELHGQAEEGLAIPRELWWSSLRIIRDAWESPEVLDVAQADPIVEQGRRLLEADVLRSVLFVPTESGLLHGPALCCPTVLGQQVDAHSSKPQALLPVPHPAEASAEALRWERFLLIALGAECLLPQLGIPQARRISAKLLDPDWWLLIQAVAPHFSELLEVHQPLGSLPFDESACWELKQCLSADFAALLQGVQLPTARGPAAAPVFGCRIGDFTPLAQDCLRQLGVTFHVDGRALLERCLDPMLQALEQKLPVHFASLSRAYAALQAEELEEEVLQSLRTRIYVPNLGVHDAGSCMYLPTSLEGMGELLGKSDLQPWYPHLRPLFVERLGVSTTLSASGCLEALRLLRHQGVPLSEEDKLLKLAAGLLLQFSQLEPSQAEISSLREEELIPLPGEELRWLKASSCMWLDVASTAEVRFASLQAHYPGLQLFFVEVMGVPLLSSVEVQARLRSAAAKATADNPAPLLHAYQDLERLCKMAEDGQDVALAYLKKDLEDLLFVPGLADPPAKDACVFLPPSQRGLAECCGKLDLGGFFPNLQDYFLQVLGISRHLPAEQCLEALRRLQREEGPNAFHLACAAYAGLEQTYGCGMLAVDHLALFSEEPLLLVSQATSSKSKSWKRSVDCMWYNVPAVDAVGTPALEGLLPRDLEEFCIEVLGVPAMSAEEVAARLDVLRRKSSQADERNNGLACEEQMVTAYIQILTALDRRYMAGCQFHNSELLHQLRERVFLPGTGFVNASKCQWRFSPSPIRTPAHDLAEAYSGRSEAALLQRYFVFWLGVPTCLSVVECLDGLRELKSTRLLRTDEPAEGPMLPRARAVYRELALALRRGDQAPRDEALIFVTGADSNWCKADQCIWEHPEDAPEGWSTDREELASQYGHDPLLKELFTERWGVPVSVRFRRQQSSASTAPVSVHGQPVWLLEESGDEGGNMPDSRQTIAGNVPESRANLGEAAKEREVQKHIEEEPKSAVPDGLDGDQPQGELKVSEDASAGRVAEKQADGGGDVPPPEPYMESSAQIRGAAVDGRRQRRMMLEKLAGSVLAIQDHRQMASRSNQVKHRSEVCVDCNPQHDLCKVGFLELPVATDASIPVWVERQHRSASTQRLKAALATGALYRFADLLLAISELFSVPCHERVHVFEEDTQTVAFNGGGLFFNLRYFVEEQHASCWEEAVSFWAVSFAHELAHFESPLHDRQHGRAMEMSQRAVLPGLPKVLARPWGAALGTQNAEHRQWRLRMVDGGLM